MPDIKAEIADTPGKRTVGLMGRKDLPDDAGMLFVFPRPDRLSFWMANTYIPLQIAFLDKSGKVLQIERMAPLSTRSIVSRHECKYALEVNDGWFDRHGISVGAQAALPADPAIQDMVGALGNEMGLPPDQAQPPAGQGQQTPPEINIRRSFKDILKECDSLGVGVYVQYVSKDGFQIPKKRIEPPFEFADTEEGDLNGIIKVWDAQKGRTSSLIVKNIQTIWDDANRPVTTVEQVRDMAKGRRNTVEEDARARGKEQSLAEQ